MNYIEAPNDSLVDARIPSVFLAGGISGCSDWQTIVSRRFSQSNLPFTLINPRRSIWPENLSDEHVKQIEWEYKYLQIADIVAFWFPNETLCPITLLELGTLLDKHDKRLVIGCDPLYQRFLDVGVQTRLRRGPTEIGTSLDWLVNQTLQVIQDCISEKAKN